MIRRCPNGGTPYVTTYDPRSEFIGPRKPTRGSEPSQYPEEQKTISDSRSSGERTGKSPNLVRVKPAGVVRIVL